MKCCLSINTLVYYTWPDVRSVSLYTPHNNVRISIFISFLIRIHYSYDQFSQIYAISAVIAV